AQFNSRGRHGLPREPIMQTRALVASAIAGVTLAMSGAFAAAGADDAGAVAALDTAYQAAVERNDWQAMDRILHPDFVLVLGNGKASDRRHLIDLARSQAITFEKQVELPGTQTVRLFGKDTATVTALLWLKGARSDDKTTFDFKLWFSDTYVRTSE